MVLPYHFAELLANVGPSDDRLNLAKNLPPLVRDHLQADDAFPTIEPHTLLVGSYARSTAVGMLKDVDVLVFVDQTDGIPKPATILSDLRDCLANMPAATTVDLASQRRSIRVEFEDYDFIMDVVPARIPDGLDKPLMVPDRAQAQWLKSDPLGYAEYLSDLDTAAGGKIRRVVRLFKHCRDHWMKIRRPKSYLLEVMIVSEMAKQDLKGRGLDSAFRAAATSVYASSEPAYLEDDAVPSISDPMLGHVLSTTWPRSSFETFMSRLSDAVRWADDALATDDHSEAIRLWQKVFGTDVFPSYVTECPHCQGDTLRTANEAGRLVVTHGVAPRLRVQPAPNSTPVPNTRFWGSEPEALR